MMNSLPYHLEGVKNIDGSNCLRLYSMLTTLFSKVREGKLKNNKKRTCKK
jgi:hypothetical protein